MHTQTGTDAHRHTQMHTQTGTDAHRHPPHTHTHNTGLFPGGRGFPPTSSYATSETLPGRPLNMGTAPGGFPLLPRVAYFDVSPGPQAYARLYLQGLPGTACRPFAPQESTPHPCSSPHLPLPSPRPQLPSHLLNDNHSSNLRGLL